MSDTPIADMIRKLTDEGVPLVAILTAVETVERAALRSVTPTVTDVTDRNGQPRSAEAIRQARWRANNPEKARKKRRRTNAKPSVTDSVTDSVTAVTVVAQSDSTGVSKKEGLSIKEDRKKERKKDGERIAREAKKATRLKVGQPLTQEYIDAAVKLGLPEAEVQKRWDEFVDYWIGAPRGAKLDWPGTWRNRIRKVMEWKAERAAKGQGGQGKMSFIDIAMGKASST